VDTDEFLVGLRELGIMLKKEESDVYAYFNIKLLLDSISSFG